MKSYLPLIIGMGIVTYIPRLVPLMFLSNKKMNNKLEDFLGYIPYTSLSILIVRGITTASHGMMIPTIMGVGVAAIIAYVKGNLVLSVLVGILLSFLVISI